MVHSVDAAQTGCSLFQYSLCRVVLMVSGNLLGWFAQQPLSVLALSSRFDGLSGDVFLNGVLKPFSTRSVESF